MNTDELCAAVTEARTYLDRFTRHSFVMPICRCAYEVLYQGKQVRDVVTELMTRSKKAETAMEWSYPNE